MDTLGLTIRVVVSLGAVLGLVWLFSRGMLRSTGGRLATTARVRVLSKVPLGRHSAMAVVKVGERALVLGVAEGRVQLLTEVALSEVVDEPTVAEVREEVDLAEVPTPRQAPEGALAGSALSPATWAHAVDVLRDRTARR